MILVEVSQAVERVIDVLNVPVVGQIEVLAVASRVILVAASLRLLRPIGFLG